MLPRQLQTKLHFEAFKSEQTRILTELLTIVEKLTDERTQLRVEVARLQFAANHAIEAEAQRPIQHPPVVNDEAQLQIERLQHERVELIAKINNLQSSLNEYGLTIASLYSENGDFDNAIIVLINEILIEMLLICKALEYAQFYIYFCIFSNLKLNGIAKEKNLPFLVNSQYARRNSV